MMLSTVRKRAAGAGRCCGFRRALAALGLVAVSLAAFGHFFLPELMEEWVERAVAEALHRRLSVGAIEFNPFALTLKLREVTLMEADGETPFASFDTLEARVSAESLFSLAPVIAELKLVRPNVRLVRIDAHRYNLDDLVEAVASRPSSNETSRFSAYNIQVAGGRVEFDDRPEGKIHTVTDIRLGVPFISSLPSRVEVFVEPELSMVVNGAPVQVQGKARPFTEPREAVVDLRLEGLDLTRYLEYLPFQSRFGVPGATLDLRLAASFRQRLGAAPVLTLGGTVSFRDVEVAGPEGKAVLKLPLLTAELGETDVFAGRFDLARIHAVGLQADLSRDRDGQLSVMRLLPASSGARPAATMDGATPYSLAVRAVDIDGATVRFIDAHGARPLHASVEKLDLAVREVALDPAARTVRVGEVASSGADIVLRQDRPRRPNPPPQSGGKAGAGDDGYAVSVDRVAIDNWTARLEDRGLLRPAVTMVAPLSLRFQGLSTARSAPGRMELQATVNKSGRVALAGDAGLVPLQADLALDLKGVDILPLQPYLADRMNLLVTRARLTTRGRLRLTRANDGAWRGGFRGALAVSDLAAVDKLGADDLLRWKSLAIDGVDLRSAPFALSARQVALRDFFARVIVDDSGRINLQDLFVDDPGEAVATADSPSDTDEPAPVRIDRLILSAGSVRFTDNFIRPNYSANLTGLEGTVSDLSSDSSSAAGVDLRGQVNTAPLAVVGRINPLKGDLFLDLKGDVKGMELAPMSPYSGKFAGYAVDKGKLSFEVAYKLEERKLAGQNRLILDQLTFGEKVESPDATDLPVQLALALLRDRNGVIDINLPVEGALDDPQFSVGGLIVQVVVNLLSKAVTAPFALLGSLFGGDEELGWLEFGPGSATVSPAGAAKLKTLASALADRPSLKLEISAGVDPVADREGLKRAFVDRKVRALKLKDLVARGLSAEIDEVIVGGDEYDALLRRAYEAEKFAKPRNLIGLQKAQPVEEMERLLIANAGGGKVDDGALRALADERAQAVKEWLLTSGQVPAERLFIIAKKAGEVRDAESKTKLSRVDFSLR